MNLLLGQLGEHEAENSTEECAVVSSPCVCIYGFLYVYVKLYVFELSFT